MKYAYITVFYFLIYSLLFHSSCKKEEEAGVAKILVVNASGAPCANAIVEISNLNEGCVSTVSSTLNASGEWEATVSPAQSVTVNIYPIISDTIISGVFPDTLMTITIDTSTISCETVTLNLQPGMVCSTTITGSCCN